MKRFLVITAHPDDAELLFGGCAVKLAKRGDEVKFVACCNGDAGHYSMRPEALAARRKEEALKSAAIAGLKEYEIIDNHDCELIPSLENRRRIIGIIRDFKPDVVISHRTYDYHADHRATAQLVQDASFLVTVPLYCPERKVPEKKPIYLFSYDNFQRPYPFSPDVAVAIDDVISEKLKMMNCHESQFYEWLAYNKGKLAEVPSDSDGKNRWLIDGWLIRNRNQVELCRELVIKRYGNKSNNIKYVESFELSEYGRQPEPGELDELFPL